MPDPDAGDVSALAASTGAAWLTSTTRPDIGEATQESTAEGNGGWKRPVMFFMERQGGTSSAGGVGSTSTGAESGGLTLRVLDTAPDTPRVCETTGESARVGDKATGTPPGELAVSDTGNDNDSARAGENVRTGDRILLVATGTVHMGTVEVPVAELPRLFPLPGVSPMTAVNRES